MEGRPITIACIESSPSSPHYSRIQLLRLVAAFPNRLRKGAREAKPSESPPSRTDFGTALARRSRARICPPCRASSGLGACDVLGGQPTTSPLGLGLPQPKPLCAS